MPTKDAIIEEVHRVRERMMLEFADDVQVYLKAMQADQHQLGHPVVSFVRIFPPRKKPATLPQRMRPVKRAASGKLTRTASI
jgi:hypothetical protein